MAIIVIEQPHIGGAVKYLIWGCSLAKMTQHTYLIAPPWLAHTFQTISRDEKTYIGDNFFALFGNIWHLYGTVWHFWHFWSLTLFCGEFTFVTIYALFSGKIILAQTLHV